MKNYRLKGRRLVVRADIPGEKIGSIIVPEIARKPALAGEVVLIGDQCGDDVKAGDRVLFSSLAMSRFNADGYGFPHVLLKEEDLLCVFSS